MIFYTKIQEKTNYRKCLLYYRNKDIINPFLSLRRFFYARKTKFTRDCE